MTETRIRADYIGYPRFVRSGGQMVPAPKRMFDPGSVYEARALTVNWPAIDANGQQSPRYRGRPRTVERLCYERAPYLMWTVADQAESVRRGYFLERSPDDYHAVVIPLPGSSYATDSDVMRETMSLAKQGDAHAVKTIMFVLQQDQRGWSGTWANSTIATYRPTLTWYKRLNGSIPLRPRKPATTAPDKPTRPRGRPKGTVAEHAARREAQMQEWRDSGTELPYAEWLATKNYLS